MNLGNKKLSAHNRPCVNASKFNALKPRKINTVKTN